MFFANRMDRYAMCDSPTGLLVFAMKGLGLLAPRMQLTPEQIITFTNLAWLPGPEYAMRYWARCAADGQANARGTKATANKPKIGITVFLGGQDEAVVGDASSTAQEVGEGAIQLKAPMNVATGAGYACPAWANAHYHVLFSQRVTGKPGLLAWERPDVILTGIRGLAKAIFQADKRRLQPAREDAPAAAALETVVVVPEEETRGRQDRGLQPPARPILEQGDSSRTQVGSQPPSSPKGKELEILTPAASDLVPEPEAKDGDQAGSPRMGTPDTIVLVTAPTGEEPTKQQ